MLSFFELYLDTDSFSKGSFGIMMLILYINIILYVLDFYHLIKRKSKAETAAILIIPITLSAMGSMLATIFVHVPEPTKLDRFLHMLQSYQLNVSLFAVPALYALFFGISLLSQLNRRKKDRVNWILSCGTDYLSVILILICLLWHIATGESIFQPGRELLLWCFLYALYFLCCKILLFAAVLLVRLYSARITVFKWQPGKNPTFFLIRYFFFYQNAIVRNVVLFELGVLIPITIALQREGLTAEMVLMLGFLYLGAAFVILACMRPMMKLMHRFSLWNSPREKKELFCREYFQEEPLYKDQNYTLTWHFLVDEQRPAAVYFWDALNTVGRWHITRKGKSRELTFLDGESCLFTGEEEESAKPVFEYAKKQQAMQLSGVRLRPPGPGTYENILKKVTMVFVMVLIFLAYIWRG